MPQSPLANGYTSGSSCELRGGEYATLQLAWDSICAPRSKSVNGEGEKCAAVWLQLPCVQASSELHVHVALVRRTRFDAGIAILVAVAH